MQRNISLEAFLFWITRVTFCFRKCLQIVTTYPRLLQKVTRSRRSKFPPDLWLTLCLLGGTDSTSWTALRSSSKTWILHCCLSNKDSSSSSLSSRSVPWLGEGLSMLSPNYPDLCCPLPYRVAPTFVQVVSPPLGWSPLSSFLVIWSPIGDTRGPSVVLRRLICPAQDHFISEKTAKGVYACWRRLHLRCCLRLNVRGIRIQMFRNAFSGNMIPPPPRDANDVGPYTFVKLICADLYSPHPPHPTPTELRNTWMAT